jgi:hypothetical protein
MQHKKLKCYRNGLPIEILAVTREARVAENPTSPSLFRSRRSGCCMLKAAVGPAVVYEAGLEAFGIGFAMEPRKRREALTTLSPRRSVSRDVARFGRPNRARFRRSWPPEPD